VNKQHDWIGGALGTNENPLPVVVDGNLLEDGKLFGYRRISISGLNPE
jgi:hypothetical protein